MASSLGRGAGRGTRRNQGRGNITLRQSIDNHREDLQTQDFGSFLPETPNTQIEQGEVSYRAPKRVLTPTGLWFDDNKISSALTDIFQSHFQHPWFNYSEVDEATKAHWWNSFIASFEWAPELDGQVRRAYKIKAGARLRDLHNSVMKKATEKPKWLGDTIYEAMKKRREDPKFLERSERAKKNRRGGSLSNPIEPSHFQGSISASQHAKKMAKSKGGVLPTAPELFLKTHFKKVPRKGEIPANKRAKEISDAYNKKLDECTTQGSQPNPNHLYWETVGGRNRGKVKGLGQGDHLYYNNPSGRGDGSSQPYVPSISSQMEAQVEAKVAARMAEVEALVAARVQAALEKERAVMAATNRALIEKMMKNMSDFDSMLSTCTTNPPPERRPHDDPGFGGDGGATQTHLVL